MYGAQLVESRVCTLAIVRLAAARLAPKRPRAPHGQRRVTGEWPEKVTCDGLNGWSLCNPYVDQAVSIDLRATFGVK